MNPSVSAIMKQLVPAFLTAKPAGAVGLVGVRPLTWVGGWPVTGQALVPVPGQAGPPAG